MTRFGFLSSLLFAAGAIATTYTDSKTGITFSSYQDSDTGCLFGMAMPEDPEKDFIGQIVAPVTDKGWAGLDLGSTMTGRLLIVAWPYSNGVVSSLRKASGYVTPPVYSSGNVSLASIEKGTFVNSTHFSYTFLCSGCITGDALSFTDSETATVMSWAYSDTAVTTPSSDSSPLSYHTAGYGEFEMNFTTAKSADYSKWAGMATLSSSNSTTGSNTTSTTSGTNSTSTSSSSTSSSSTSSTNTTATVSNSTYDYIIAGGGPAGIIAAERIAESGASVLLIERGAASTYASGGRSVVSWNDTITQYDVPALGYYLTNMNDTSEYCTDTASEAGCLLGGSSMINALMFVRPQEIDFDDKWPTGWKWSDVSGSADKFYERNPGTINPSADGVHYDDGAYDILSKFFSGNGWSSVNALEEPNSKQQVFSHPTWNIQNGLRAGPTLSYLPFAKALDNFHLQLNTKVIRAVRNGSSVTGVEVETSSGRQIINVNAGGRVVLASGTLSTPRILFNSGIGPSAQIQTVQSGSTSVTLPSESDWINLPVGEGVKDHPIVVMKFNTTQGLESMYNTAFTAPTLNNTDLFAHGKGPLVEAGQRFNFWTSVNSSDGSTRYIQGTCNSPSENEIQMKVYLTHGLTSSGTLEITSDGNTQFSVAPYFTTDMDKEALSSFLDTLLSYSRTANSTLTYISSGSSNVTGSDLISSYISGSHFVGTAKMGTDDGRTDNGTSVVDTNTKVYGTDNLFVVDASIHPDLPTGNTQAIVMVAAEAAASKILALSNSTTSSTSSSGSASSSAAVSSAAATSSAVLSSSVSTAASTFTTSIAASVATSGPAPNYGRCGGIGYTGATKCGIGFTCKVQNPYYSQCVQNS